ncbi:MAG: MBL fold metallo-hydrolase [Clostridia bacterium]|nr:MBL fold metallo-hydrolase [Clostridia bacterium]
MRITRTANAGILLQMDNISILLDGVCGQIPPYCSTPNNLRNELTVNLPDIVAFTHYHLDHYDEQYAKAYEKLTSRNVVQPNNCDSLKVGNVFVQPFKSRHIGKNDVSHISFIIKGSYCVWFLGDASPLSIKSVVGLPTPDVLVVPYAYANTDSSFKLTRSFGAKHIVLLHMPLRENDAYGIYDDVKKTVQGDSGVYIPEMGESLDLN